MASFSVRSDFQAKMKKCVQHWYKMVQKWPKDSPNMVLEAAKSSPKCSLKGPKNPKIGLKCSNMAKLWTQSGLVHDRMQDFSIRPKPNIRLEDAESFGRIFGRIVAKYK